MEKRNIWEPLWIPEENVPARDYPKAWGSFGQAQITPDYAMRVIETAKMWGKKLGYIRVFFLEDGDHHIDYEDSLERGFSLRIGSMVAYGERLETDEELTERAEQDLREMLEARAVNAARRNPDSMDKFIRTMK